MSAKEIHLQPISAQAARRIVRRYHYSHKVVQNSQLHLGVFYRGTCEGAMQFGPGINKKRTLPLVANTGWNNYIELNRMAFSDVLPRNSESRALAVAMRILRKQYPHLRWVITFADATVCGDGTIYRAAGFKLVQIRKNDAIRRNPVTGETMHVIQAHHLKISRRWRTWPLLPGQQLKYLYFLDPAAEADLQVPVIPYSALADAGVGMYMGKQREKQARMASSHTAAGQHRPSRSN